MKRFLNNFYTSFPVQLLLMHFKKYQILLFIWYLLFSMINGGFLKNYGAEALFFSPEYNGSAGFSGLFLLGLGWGMIIMSWNITTFIIHSKRFIFLAAVTHPFLKYCVNNVVLPATIFIFYLCKLFVFARDQELKSISEILMQYFAIFVGIAIAVITSFLYFYITGQKIEGRLSLGFLKKEESLSFANNKYGLAVNHFFDARFKFLPIVDTHYLSKERVDVVFRRHHLAAVTVIILGFIVLATIGFFLDLWIFELPAGLCIIMLYAILIAVVGAFSYFLQSWSLPFAILLIGVLNLLIKYDYIDPRNEAFGMKYADKQHRPSYDKASIQALCNDAAVTADSANMIKILNNWKKKQNTDKPVMVFINASGGGLRSAAFTMKCMQRIDSATNGALMKQTFMISGASGGMLAATYYRELYRTVTKQTANPAFYEEKYSTNVTKDILNSVFSSLVARDLLATKQKVQIGSYSFKKDRGYAFEKKLGDNTEGLLDATIAETAVDEFNAKIPLVIFNAVINRDGRKLVIGSQPYSFMMKSSYENREVISDAVDFGALFKNQNPMNIRLVTALRMNASFPYILPSVWLPTKPVIDVMDAGLRDNYGQETTLRFVNYFQQWINENTGGVVIVQLWDEPSDNWQKPVETKNISDMLVTPGTMVQSNWHKLQHDFLSTQYEYFKGGMAVPVYKAEIQYNASSIGKAAAMSLHITANEKREIERSIDNAQNQATIKAVIAALKLTAPTSVTERLPK